jgi:SAM-dependent methyltransferase
MSGNDAVFSGPIPLLYDRYGEGLLFGPYAADIVRRLSGLTDGRLLETAAGTGIVTRGLAVALPPTVEIVATDLNQPMLDHAATKRDMGRVRFQQADAMALPFADASFDAVVCQFGIMFFPDRVAGMREARRVLKPGGRFVFSVWGRLTDNPLLASVVSALAERYPSHPSWFRIPAQGFPGDELMTPRTSAVAVCCSRASRVSVMRHSPSRSPPVPRSSATARSVFP